MNCLLIILSRRHWVADTLKGVFVKACGAVNDRSAGDAVAWALASAGHAGKRGGRDPKSPHIAKVFGSLGAMQ